jgi:hypothetical protein
MGLSDRQEEEQMNKWVKVGIAGVAMLAVGAIGVSAHTSAQQGRVNGIAPHPVVSVR